MFPLGKTINKFATFFSLVHRTRSSAEFHFLRLGNVQEKTKIFIVVCVLIETDNFIFGRGMDWETFRKKMNTQSINQGMVFFSVVWFFCDKYYFYASF